MNPHRLQLPFSSLGFRGWVRISCTVLIILLAIACLLYVAMQVGGRGLFGYVGLDYRVWYACAGIIREHGFASVYDLSLQSRYQQPLFEQYDLAAKLGEPLWTLPAAYLPVFFLPTLLLLYMPPVSGFILFVLANAIITWLYLWSLVRRIGLTRRSFTILLVFLSLPVLQNLLFGQVNVLLLIALGESLMALRTGKHLRAGMWLAGLSLKPQTLPLFFLGFLIRRNFRALAGLVLVGLVLAGASLLLVGPDTVPHLVQIVSDWPTGLVSTGINWRAVAYYLSGVFSPASITVILVLGMIGTTVAGIYLWLPGIKLDQTLLFLGTYAAACTIAWHGHVHMALPMLAPGVLLWAEGRLPTTLACFWLFVPTALFLATAFTLSFGLAHDIGAMSMLVANLVVLVWTVHTAWKGKHRTLDIAGQTP
jgi:hypothetical protein